MALAAALGVASLAAPSAQAAATRRRRVDVTEKDFAVKARHTTVSAGVVVLHIRNAGPSTHELNVDRTDDPAADLPLKPDGLTVNEDARSLHRVDSIEELDLGDSGDLTLRLRPGHYVLYCNLEGHYLGGMHLAIDVVGGSS